MKKSDSIASQNLCILNNVDLIIKIYSSSTVCMSLTMSANTSSID